MAIKFTDLTAISGLNDQDVFAVTVDSVGTSAKITYGTLRTNILESATTTQQINLLKTGLNASNAGLNADLLDGQHGSFYQAWANVTGKPTIPTDIHDLDNALEEGGGTGGFIRIRPQDNKLVYHKKENGEYSAAPVPITTTNINEGTNKFYNDSLVEAFFDQNFAKYFNKLNVTFDEGNVIDSFFDTVAYAPIVNPSNETNTIRIKTEGQIPGVGADYNKREQGARFDSYQVGKNIRIFGADSADTQALLPNQAAFSIQTEGFNTFTDAEVGGNTPTFNAATGITDATNTIAITAHGLVENEPVIYNSGGSTTDIGLVSGTTYYVFNAQTDTLQLKAATTDSGAVTINTGSGASHTLTPVQIDAPFQKLTYSICEWDLNTGKVTPPTAESSTNISIPSGSDVAANDVPQYLSNNQQRLLQDFSVENFVKLQFTYNDTGSTLSGITPGRGICIYRRIAQVNTTEEQLKGEPKLVAVLGPKELKQNNWIDYYTDDILTHSGKNQEDNTYVPEKTVHFKPLEVPSAANGGRGWVDAVIQGITYENVVNPSLSTYIDVELSGNIIMDAGESAGVWVSHNDTSLIQSAINTNSQSGRKAIQFNPKTYIISKLVIPNSFSIAGYAYNTKLTRLPWAGWGGSAASSSSAMIESAGLRLLNTSFVGFDVDGNSINSIQFDDTSDATVNYCINFGQFNNSILVDKVRVSKPIGGGVYAPDPINLKIVASEFLDSGITDRHVYAPLIADGGSNTFVSSNRFENFSKGSVDVSLTDKAAIEGNIIANCGSGLVVFGSKFMISSPNVITGPSGEFLPTPDSYNSEYDLINIDLTSSSLQAGGPASFDSDKHKYQENGENFNLGSGPEYKIFAIKKPVGGEESVWIDDLQPPLGMSQRIVTSSFDATLDASFDFTDNAINLNQTSVLIFADAIVGGREYRIEQNPVNQTLINALASSPTFSGDPGVGDTFTAANPLPVDMAPYASMGVSELSSGHKFETGDPVIYNSNGGVSPSNDTAPNLLTSGETYFIYKVDSDTVSLYTSRVDAQNGPAATGKVTFTNGSGTGEQNLATGTNHTLTRNVFLGFEDRAESDNLPSEGGFQYTIPADTVRKIKLAGQPYTVDYMKDPTNTIYHRNASKGFASTAGDPDHIGLGYSASITTSVDAAMIVNGAGNPGVWSESGGDVIYTVIVRDYKYMSIGRKVKPKDLGLNAHNGFSPGSGNPDVYGEITGVGGTDEEAVIQITWPNANIADATGGAGGILEVEDTFVIATGRIK